MRPSQVWPPGVSAETVNNHMCRSTAVDRLWGQEEPFDFLIVGGGATGLGAAVDAASRGYRVALIEQSDFAKGTSSRSTKLVHGGVRYLKQGNISLVKEALRERGLLYANAPHLVHNMMFVIPNYSWMDQAFYGVGMKVYDGLAGRLGLSPSRVFGVQRTRDLLPTVEHAGLVGGVSYHDGQFDDTRLAINLAQTAQQYGAVVANYVRAVGLIKEKGVVRGVEAKDVEGGREFCIRARCVINATGVFVDAMRQIDEPNLPKMVALSQGIHLVLPKEFLPGKAALMVPKTADGRVLFAVPWHDSVVVGTTDTPVTQHSLEPRPLDEEKEFVLSHAAKYLTKDPAPSDVKSVFCGLRPLVKSGSGTNTAALSRDHTISISSSQLLTVTGGKWTTYRRMAEDVINQAERVGGLPARPCQTAHLKIHGGAGGVTASETGHLAVYGSDGPSIKSTMTAEPVLAARLHPDLPFTEGEVVWHARHEMARTVEDILARRMRMLLLDAQASKQAAPKVAAILAKELGRDRTWEMAQVAEYENLANGYVFN